MKKTHIFLKCLRIRKKTTTAKPKKNKEQKTGGDVTTSPLDDKGEGPDWLPPVGGGRSILPQRRCVNHRAIAHQRPALVSPQVLAIGALDGDASVFHKLQEKVLWLLSVGTHQSAAGDVPEPAAGTCSGTVRLAPLKSHHTSPWGQTLTLYVVGAVVEDQPEDVVDRAVGDQSVGVLVVAHESVLTAQDQHGPVYQLHQEQFVIAYGGS